MFADLQYFLILFLRIKGQIVTCKMNAYHSHLNNNMGKELIVAIEKFLFECGFPIRMYLIACYLRREKSIILFFIFLQKSPWKKDYDSFNRTDSHYWLCDLVFQSITV